MRADIPDPQVCAAVAAAVGHGPPFDTAELAELYALDIAHARSLDGLGACRRLTVFTLVGCSVGDWSVLADCPALRTVRIEHCDLADVSSLAHPSVLGVRLLGCRVAELEPFAELAALIELDVRGNPLSERSTTIVDLLRARRVDVTVDDDEVVRLNRRLADAGVPLAMYQRSDATRLSPVGLALTEWPEAAHARVTAEQVNAVLDEGRDVVDFFHRNRPGA